MLKKHQSFKYLIAKFKYFLFQKQHPNYPWLNQDAILLLENLISKNDIGLEFGSGRSTIWLAKMCRSLISIENNENWFHIVNQQIKSFDNIQYLFKSVNTSQPNESEYLDIINELENESVDFILNDGKIRDLVALKTLPKLKSGGIFILDNAERYIPHSFDLPESINVSQISTNWNEFLEHTRSWRKIWISNNITSTLILFKH